MSREDFREKSVRAWRDMIAELFGAEEPHQKDWKGLGEIVKVLQFIGQSSATNHMFIPTGGGQDILDSVESHEPGCIELHFNPSGRSASIVKPSALTFNLIENALEWSYFRLELDSLQPSGVYNALSTDMEELTELSPGHYVERTWWDAGYYGHDENGSEIPLPESARIIVRHMSGPFVIFAKGSIYNANPGTYDARHAKMPPDVFREYISNSAHKLK